MLNLILESSFPQSVERESRAFEIPGYPIKNFGYDKAQHCITFFQAIAFGPVSPVLIRTASLIGRTYTLPSPGIPV